MFRYQPSISNKITLGYYGFVAIIIGISIFTFMELRYVEGKIMFGEVISEFLNATLEIRRFEKNYFLYGQKTDYVETIKYADLVLSSLEHNAGEFTLVASPARMAMLSDNLRRYKNLMWQYALLPPKYSEDVKETTAGKIRKTGKDITEMAEDISKAERKNLQAILFKSQRVLVLSIITLSLLGIAIGQAVSRMIVRPLKKLEESMEIIASGEFDKINIDSKDREIVSLTNAFNKMLRELELRQRHIIQSEKLASLGTLLSGVAHELNNPLSNISTSCQILLEELKENDIEYKKELLEQIDAQADRSRNIVRSLLDFSRDKEFRKGPVNLRGLIEETIRFIRGQVPTKVEITVDMPDDIDIVADKQRIQQAFLNLIKNAVEAVEEEGTISIRAKKYTAAEKAEDESEIYNYLKYKGKCTLEEDTVDIQIKDSGTGIPENMLSKIFDPFFTTKDVGKGSGLGLSIVYEIIEEHDGCIAVDSEAGKGATFLIRLPLKN